MSILAEKGTLLKLRVSRLAAGGDGIARVQDAGNNPSLVVFVPYAAPGDLLEVRITESKTTFARGEIVRVIEPGPDRVAPPCPYYYAPLAKDWCGGCNIQHLSYPAQLKTKLDILKDALHKIAHLRPELLLPVAGTANPETQAWRYRNKIQMPYAHSDDGKSVRSGFYAPSSHRIVEINDCLIHPETMSRITTHIRQKMQTCMLTPYSEQKHSGWLRHTIVRTSQNAAQVLVTLVTTDEQFPDCEKWYSDLRAICPELVGLCQNINTERTNTILGKKWKPLAGQDFIIEELPNIGPGQRTLQLKISAPSFFQLNSSMTCTLYQTTADFARPAVSAGQETLLLDLYCGIGGIALSNAGAFNRVIGVDEGLSSISDAEHNAALNKITNCEFVGRPVESFLRNMPLSSPRDFHCTVIVDPPRDGCTSEVLTHLVSLAPQKIVYVSCDPSTLARDIAWLSAHKYKARKIQPIDLFPQTSHIESVTLIEPA